MPIPVTCTHCGANFGVKEKCAGMRGRCPKCNGTVQVPDVPQADALDTSWLDDVETDAPPEHPAPKRQPQPPVQPQPVAPRPRAVPAPAAASTNGSIEFHCGKCGAGFKVTSSLAGRTAKCQKCGEALRVPTASQPKAVAPSKAPIAPSRPQPHFPNPLATPAKKVTVPAAEDDLLSELGEGFGLSATEQALSARRDPFASASLPTTKLKSRRNKSTFSLELAWPDYTFLSLCGVGAFFAIWSGFWLFMAVPPACLTIWIVVVAGFMHGEIALGVLSLFCTPCAYIIGWVKASEWRLGKVMIGWTLSIPLFLLAITMPAIMAAQAAAEKNAAAERAFENGPTASSPTDLASAARNGQVTPTASNVPVGWQPYVSVEGGFRIALPAGTPNDEVKMAPGGMFSRMVIHGVETPDRRAMYGVVFTSPPIPLDESRTKDMLDSGAAGLKNTPGFTKLSERSLTVAGHPARSVEVSMPEGQATYVFFVARGRLYQLLAGRRQGGEELIPLQTFLDTFEFLSPDSPSPQSLPAGMSIVRGGSGSGPGGPSHGGPAASGNLPDGTPPRVARPHRMAESKDDFEEAMDYLASNTPVFGLKALADMRPNDQRARVIAAVMPFLASTDDSLQSDAVKVLGIWGTEQELPAMLDLLDDSDTFVRHDAIDAVARFKTPAVAEAIADRLPEDGMQSEEALREMGAVAESAVTRYLKHPDQFTRATACEILGDIGTPKCAPELFKLEHDPSFHVVTSADEALRKIRFRHNVDAKKSTGADDGDNPFDDE